MKRVRDGAELVVLTDRTVCDGERRYLDPHLATSAIDQALKHFKVELNAVNLRRCSIVLRSAAIRNVHDVVLALGLEPTGSTRTCCSRWCASMTTPRTWATSARRCRRASRR